MSVQSLVRSSTRLIVAVGVVAGLTQWAPASAEPAQSSTAADPAGWVTGTVLDGAGNPIKGALVNVLGPREVPEVGIIAATTDRRGWTNAQGRFKVPAVRARLPRADLSSRGARCRHLS